MCVCSALGMYMFVQQVSLWGGDVVLKNLELRLDVIEQELGLPLQRGCIRNLTLHVPWSALSYEAVIVTIDTIEVEVASMDEGEWGPWKGVCVYEAETVTSPTLMTSFAPSRRWCKACMRGD